MALLKCPDCEKESSSDARKCVHCGCNIKKFYKNNKKCESCSGYVYIKAKKCNLCGVKFKKKTSPFVKLLAWGVGAYACIGLFAALIGGGSTTSNKSKTTSSSGKYVTESFVCKAAIAENFGRGVRTMNSEKMGSKYHITYIRPQDNTRWGNYCWVVGNRVLWQTDGSNNTGINGRPGRVRNTEWDEIITYSVKPNRLTINIRYPDGSAQTQVYKIPKGS